MSIKDDISANLKNIDETELTKFCELAFNQGMVGNDFAKGFDYAIAYLNGSYDKEEIEANLD